ncbi:small ribosomal subunit protein uS5m-like [Babylonia areolata]|uniref:small ribosomal subunit protein uS5m-like n=1 Tax=Babylonia areolata TaxID=304850 RepID=UPI003FD0D95B
MAAVFCAVAVKLARASSACSVSVCAGTQYRRAHCLSVLTQNVTRLETGLDTQLSFTRNASLFGKLTSDDLWGGVYGVSNAGRKRGRAKRGSKKIDLNKGQIVGVGKDNIVWPGLNAPVVKGREMIGIKPLPPDPERENKIREIRDKGSQFRRFKTPALQRGWTGAKRAGTSIGPPDPVGDYKFEGFDTRVLEFKLVTNMTGNLGRKQRFSSFVVTGNKNGLAGFALAKAPNGSASLRKAKNMAAQRLQYIERYRDHTVFHNFYTKEKQTALYVYKAAKGKGLTCHRAIRTMCEVIGIEDLSAKVEGSTSNIQNITKALFAGLQKQETHQELADRAKLNVVEFRSEMDNIPIVVARPKEGQTALEGIKEEGFDFENLYYRGKVPLTKPKRDPFYYKLKSWRIKKRFLMKMRNQKQAQLEREALGLEPSLEEKKLRARPLR